MNARWSDEDVLEMLHLRDNEGLTFRQIGERMDISDRAVIGACHRVRVAEVPGDAGDGTMSPRWWLR